MSLSVDADAQPGIAFATLYGFTIEALTVAVSSVSDALMGRVRHAVHADDTASFNGGALLNDVLSLGYDSVKQRIFAY